MPQIISLQPTAPSASPAAPVSLPRPDPTQPNFLMQFKSALKNLAIAAVLPQITTLRAEAAQNGAPLMSPLPEPQSAIRVAPAADKPVDANLPALLAELGFAVVPLVFVAPGPTANAVGTGPTGGAPQPPRTLDAAGQPDKASVQAGVAAPAPVAVVE